MNDNESAEGPRRAPDGSLQVTVERGPYEARVAPSGDIGRATAASLRAALDGVIRDEEVRRVTVDLSDVRFADASALRLLTDASREARSAGSAFAVERPQRHVHRLFVLTGLQELLV